MKSNSKTDILFLILISSICILFYFTTHKIYFSHNFIASNKLINKLQLIHDKQNSDLTHISIKKLVEAKIQEQEDNQSKTYFLLFFTICLILVIIYLSVYYKNKELLLNSKHKQSMEYASMTNFYAELAHDINNPLTVVTSQIQVLRKKIQQDFPTSNYLQRLDKTVLAIKKINKLVNSMRKNSRSNTLLAHTNLKSLILESLDFLELKLQKENIIIENNITEDDLVVHGDEIQLTRVIANLIHNSFDELIKMENSQKRWIKFFYHCDSNYIYLHIQDSGTAIPKVIQKKMFEKYFTTKPAEIGTGLGLSSSRDLLRQENGDLTYKTIENHPTFIMRLKIKSEESSDLAA